MCAADDRHYNYTNQLDQEKKKYDTMKKRQLYFSSSWQLLISYLNQLNKNQL